MLVSAWLTAQAPTGDWHISWTAYCFMRDRLQQLERELYAMRVDRDHWYLRANHSPEEIREMYLQASKGQDKRGRWLWPDGERTAA
jgi:hypothetical protein